MNEKYIVLLKKYWPIAVAIFFALAMASGLIQRDDNQYTVNNQGGEIKLSEGAQSGLWGFYNKAKELAPEKKEQKSTVSFLAVGDIMLSRNVAAEIKKYPIPTHGIGPLDLPFQVMADILESTNFNFGNLESPFDPKEKGIVGGHSMIFAAPAENITGLFVHNFKILNLANNHALDMNLEGLNFTAQILDKNNLKHIGTGKNLDEAWKPSVIDANGIKICFIGASYASVNDSGKTTNNYVSRIEDLDRLKLTIGYLSAKGGSAFGGKSACDFVVASMHAGTEYTRQPNQAQIDFAHAAIDYGADIIIGHHPHWIQTIERYCPNVPSSPGEEKMPGGQMRSNCSNPKYIFYSLGNFIFDQMWSQETREGLTIKMTISKAGCHPERPKGAEGSLNNQNLRDSSASLGMTCGDSLQGPRTPTTIDSIELIPIIIDNYSTPRPANAEEAKKILEKINMAETILK